MEITKDDVGKLVAYFYDGWRYGYIEQLSGTKKKGYHSAKIRPIGAIKGKKPHSVTIPLTDIEKTTENSVPTQKENP